MTTPNERKAQPSQPSKPMSDRECREKVEQALDDALADSFPASDPVSIVTSQNEECWSEQREENGRKPESRH